MKFNQYISDDGLFGKLSEEQKEHRRATIEARYKDWMKTGMPRRECLKRAQFGVSAQGFPDYTHRSSEDV